MKTEDTKPATPVTQATTTTSSKQGSATPTAAAPGTTTANATTTAAPSTTATPTSTYSATPWATAQVSTDLKTAGTHTATLPYQHYQAYSSHYPQAAYGHYQYAASMTTQTIQAQLSRPASVPAPVTAASTQPATTSANNAAAAADSTDITTLNDALGSAGVDLRAEEESLQRSYDQHQPYRPYEDRTRKQPPKPSFDVTHLGTKMRTIAGSHKVTRIPDDSINYVALALRARLQDLIMGMIAASHHRTDTQFDRPASLYNDGKPMWSIVVRADIGKQLTALEKVEREEEMKIRRERKERAELTAAHAAILAAQAGGNAASTGEGTGGTGGEEEGGAKKKRKKDGPGVTARNMSEDVRKKMSNAVATQAAGLGGKYAWMTAANASSPAPKPKPTPSTTNATSTSTAGGGTASASATSPATTAATTAGTSTTPASSWARPYIPTKKSTSSTPAQPAAEEDVRTTVTMRDAVFVIEKERGHGGGRGAARGFL